jgi:hypothetical protein
MKGALAVSQGARLFTSDRLALIVRSSPHCHPGPLIRRRRYTIVQAQYQAAAPWLPAHRSPAPDFSLGPDLVDLSRRQSQKDRAIVPSPLTVHYHYSRVVKRNSTAQMAGALDWKKPGHNFQIREIAAKCEIGKSRV